MRYSTLLPALVALHSTLARPTQPEITNTTILPTHFGLVVFPHFQVLDVFGPMDILNSVFLFWENSTVVPQFSVLSKTMDPVTSARTPGGFGQEIMPTTTFSDYLASREQAANNNTAVATSPATDKGDIDVLIVPGGRGTRRNVTEEINFIKQAYPKLKYIISVCTGAILLSRAGVLDGRNATTNKAAWVEATAHGHNVTWMPTARWVEDGNVITTSGVSAGIDGVFAFVSKVYGDEVAQYVSYDLEYTRHTDPRDDPFGKIWGVPGAV